jgi:hypothetical protein
MIANVRKKLRGTESLVVVIVEESVVVRSLGKKESMGNCSGKGGMNVLYGSAGVQSLVTGIFLAFITPRGQSRLGSGEAARKDPHLVQEQTFFPLAGTSNSRIDPGSGADEPPPSRPQLPGRGQQLELLEHVD